MSAFVKHHILVAGGAIAAAGFATPALATEGGGSIYPVGTENYACCALPPPGVYGTLYTQAYSADKLRGDGGQTISPPGFRVRATSASARLIWVTPVEVAGGSLALHAIVPLVNLEVRAALGNAQTKTGIGDIVFGPAIGWHHDQKLHTLLALDFDAPTGDYSRSNLANIGRNYWALQPVIGISRVDPMGLNVDAKIMWTYNFRNRDTHYRSGQELIIDYAVGWGLGHGWTLGVGGYIYHQLNDDKLKGVAVPNNKGRSLAIGPSVKYDSGQGWFLTAKMHAETKVRNRAEGTGFLVKAVVPF